MRVASVGDEASQIAQQAISALVARGEALGFDVEREVPVQGGRLDIVWFLKDLVLPHGAGRLPLVAFEVESSWRTRKHVKGDYLNLADLGASLGVIVLLGDDPKVESLRRFARTLVDRPGPRIVVWSDADVDQLAHTSENLPGHPDTSSQAEEQASEHGGKYHRLWAWLRDQPGERLDTTFGEIEEVIGMRLPPSSRKHAGHWHSYDGSAVVRAVHDAGWRARDVNFERERVSFVRAHPSDRHEP